MKINIKKLQDGGNTPTFSLPQIEIYPQNKFGDIARLQGLETARNWRKVKEGTTAGINEFASPITEVTQTASSFLPVVGDTQDAVSFYLAAKDNDKVGMALSGLGFLPFIGAPFSKINNLRRKAYKQITAGKRIENLKNKLINNQQYYLNLDQKLSNKLNKYESLSINREKILPTKSIVELSPINYIKAGNENLTKYFQTKHPDVKSVEFIPGNNDPDVFDWNPHTIKVTTDSKGINNSVTTGDFSIPLFGTKNKATGKLSLDSSDNTIYTFKAKTPILSSITKETGKSNLSIPSKYIEALKHNIDFLQRKFPGFKPFGSSVGAANINFPHITHDIDGFMTEEAFAPFKEGLFPFRTDSNGLPQTYKYNLGKQYGEAGDIDINIINKDPKTGLAIGENAAELFRQFFPEDYYKATLHANGNPIQINKTPQQLIDAFNPETKTIADAFEIDFTKENKFKHAGRPYIYMSYANPDKVSEGLHTWAKSNFGNNVQFGPTFKGMFDKYEDNIELLKSWQINGNLDAIAKDPKKMQNAYDYWFLNKTISNRGVDTYNLRNGTVLDATTTWNPNSIGGNAMGAGLNTVSMGNSGYGNIYSALQPEMNFSNAKNIQDVTNQLNKQFGYKDYKFTAEEVKTIKDLAIKHGINLDDIESPIDILDNIPNTGEKSNSFLKELSTLGIDGITRPENYGTGNYRSLTRQFNPNSDIVSIGTPRPNSIQTRNNFLNTNFNSDPYKFRNIWDRNKFYINYGNKDLTDRRLKIYNKIINDLSKRKYATRIIPNLDFNRFYEVNDKYAQNIQNLKDKAEFIGLTGLGTGGLAWLFNKFNNNSNSEN